MPQPPQPVPGIPKTAAAAFPRKYPASSSRPAKNTEKTPPSWNRTLFCPARECIRQDIPAPQRVPESVPSPCPRRTGTRARQGPPRKPYSADTTDATRVSARQPYPRRGAPPPSGIPNKSAASFLLTGGNPLPFSETDRRGTQTGAYVPDKSPDIAPSVLRCSRSTARSSVHISPRLPKSVSDCNTQRSVILPFSHPSTVRATKRENVTADRDCAGENFLL